MKLIGAFYGLIAFAIFATHDVVIKFLGGHYAPFQLVFFASLFSFPLVSLMLMQDRTEGHLRPVYLRWTVLRMSSNILAGLGAFYAFSVLPLAQAYAIIFAMPLVITLLAVPLLGERIGLHRGGAVLAGLVGVFIVLRPGSAEITSGHLAALVCAFSGALTSIIVRKVGREERTVVLMLYPLVGNFLVMGALMGFHYRPMPLADLGAIAAVSLLGFLAGLFLVWAYKASEAAIVAPMQYSQMIWATIYGYLIFDEKVDLPTMIGAGIIILAGIYIVYREAQGGQSENTPVLKNRSRASTAASFRVSVLLRRPRRKERS